MLEQPRGDPRHALRERGLGDTLGDAFSIYGARVGKLALISAVGQVPASALGFIPTQSLALSAAFAFIGGVATAAVYAAVAVAVGQICAFGRVSAGECWARVGWRGLSVLLVGVFYGAVSAAMLFPLDSFLRWGDEFAALAAIAESSETDAPALPPPPLAASLGALALTAAFLCLAVYMVAAVPAIVVEGRRGTGALARGFRLARGGEWRILGHVIVYALTMVGLTVAITLPFLIVGSAVGGEAASLGSQIISAAGAMAAGVFAAPVFFIAATLLYFDIRLKKEGYGMSRLSQEMGAPPARTQSQ